MWANIKISRHICPIINGSATGGGDSDMADDAREQLPRHKSDYERVRAVVALGYPGVAPVLPDLLVWLQDANWPISRSVARFLVSIGEPVDPFVREVFAGTDGIWKYWCIELFVRALPRAAAAAFRPDLERLAYQATADDRLQEVDERAREALAWLDAEPDAEPGAAPDPARDVGA
jgi:hypothetical protein